MSGLTVEEQAFGFDPDVLGKDVGNRPRDMRRYSCVQSRVVAQDMSTQRLADHLHSVADIQKRYPGRRRRRDQFALEGPTRRMGVGSGQGAGNQDTIGKRQNRVDPARLTGQDQRGTACSGLGLGISGWEHMGGLAVICLSRIEIGGDQDDGRRGADGVVIGRAIPDQFLS